MTSAIQEAVDLLLSAVDKIDTRLHEIDLERDALLVERDKIVAIVGERGSPGAYRPLAAAPVEVAHAPVTPSQAPARREASPAPADLADTGVRDVDATNRIVALLERKRVANAVDVYAAARLNKWKTKSLLNQLVAVGRVVRTGSARGTRYSLPGRADAAAAEPEGDRGARRAARRR